MFTKRNENTNIRKEKALIQRLFTKRTCKQKSHKQIIKNVSFNLNNKAKSIKVYSQPLFLINLVSFFCVNLHFFLHVVEHCIHNNNKKGKIKVKFIAAQIPQNAQQQIYNLVYHYIQI